MQPARIDRFNPIITIKNESKAAKDRDVKRVIRALQKQIDKHFAPAWGLHARLVFNVEHARAMKVVIKDVSDEAGDLGYHFCDGYPVTYLFAEDDLKELGEFSSTLSHELLEMLTDPGANLYADGFYRIKHGVKRKAMIPYEVCDAVQDNLYKIDGVPVSDFVLPEWFEPEHKGRTLKMDYLGVIRRPFDLAPGGYTDVVAGKRFFTVFAHKAREKKQRHRHARRKTNWSAART